jgi:hypothetical protein
MLSSVGRSEYRRMASLSSGKYQSGLRAVSRKKNRRHHEPSLGALKFEEMIVCTNSLWQRRNFPESARGRGATARLRHLFAPFSLNIKCSPILAPMPVCILTSCIGPASGARHMSIVPKNIAEYLRQFANQLEEKILQQFPPLHQPGKPLPPELARLRRRPYPAQALAIAGIAKRWDIEKSAGAIAECGTGKTLISLGAVFVHAKGKPFTALAMVPPQLVEKMARECFLTLPRVRVFFIDGVRNGVGSNGHTGVNEVKLRNGRIVREGLRTTLSDLRLRKHFRSPRSRWGSICDCPAIFIVSRERAKLGYFWRHAYGIPRSGPFNGAVVNPDTGRPVLTNDDQLRRADFRRAKHSELVCGDEESNGERTRRTMFSALWQADGSKVRRCAPMDFIGRNESTTFCTTLVCI